MFHTFFFKTLHRQKRQAADSMHRQIQQAADFMPCKPSESKGEKPEYMNPPVPHQLLPLSFGDARIVIVGPRQDVIAKTGTHNLLIENMLPEVLHSPLPLGQPNGHQVPILGCRWNGRHTLLAYPRTDMATKAPPCAIIVRN